MDDERVPHQEEGHGRPQVMAAVVQVERGERVGKDIGQRQDRVKEEEETYLDVVLQEVEDPRPKTGWVVLSAHAAALR